MIIQLISTYLPSAIWIGLAMFGIYNQSQAIGRSIRLLEIADRFQVAPILKTRLKNDLLMFQVRLGLIFNNLILGVTVVIGSLGYAFIIHSPWFLFYYVLTFTTNEAALIFMTYRDQKMLGKAFKQLL